MNTTEKRQLLGILGGLGPMASAYFYELITEHTGIKSTIADDPTTCVALGTGKALEQMHLLTDDSNSVAGRKYYDM